jgi:hypothetical protein
MVTNFFIIAWSHERKIGYKLFNVHVVIIFVYKHLPLLDPNGSRPYTVCSGSLFVSKNNYTA